MELFQILNHTAIRIQDFTTSECLIISVPNEHLISRSRWDGGILIISGGSWQSAAGVVGKISQR